MRSMIENTATLPWSCEHHMLCFQTSLYSGKGQTKLRGLNEANKRSNVTARMVKWPSAHSITSSPLEMGNCMTLDSLGLSYQNRSKENR